MTAVMPCQVQVAVVQARGMSFPVGRYSTRSTRSSSTRWSTSSRSAASMPWKAASRPAGPATSGKIISRSRSARPAARSCRARERLPIVRSGTSLPAFKSPDLSYEIAAADSRVRPGCLRQGTGEHHRLQAAHPGPALVPDLLGQARQQFVRAPTHEHNLRCRPLSSDPLRQLWAQVAEVAREPVRARPAVHGEEEVDRQGALQAAASHRLAVRRACDPAVPRSKTHDDPGSHRG